MAADPSGGKSLFFDISNLETENCKDERTEYGVDEIKTNYKEDINSIADVGIADIELDFNADVIGTNCASNKDYFATSTDKDVSQCLQIESRSLLNNTDDLELNMDGYNFLDKDVDRISLKEECDVASNNEESVIISSNCDNVIGTEESISHVCETMYEHVDLNASPMDNCVSYVEETTTTTRLGSIYTTCQCDMICDCSGYIVGVKCEKNCDPMDVEDTVFIDNKIDNMSGKVASTAHQENDESFQGDFTMEIRTELLTENKQIVDSIDRAGGAVSLRRTDLVQNMGENHNDLYTIDEKTISSEIRTSGEENEIDVSRKDNDKCIHLTDANEKQVGLLNSGNNGVEMLAVDNCSESSHGESSPIDEAVSSQDVSPSYSMELNVLESDEVVETDPKEDAKTTMENAFKCKATHPKRAISLFWRAGKGFSLLTMKEEATECFTQLICLLEQQLSRIAIQVKRQKFARVDSLSKDEASSSDQSTDGEQEGFWSTSVDLSEEQEDDDSNNNQNPARVKRGYLIEEFIETEIGYIDDLNFVVENYIPELSREDVPEELKGRERTIFSNIQDLCSYHRDSFLKDLERIREDPETLGSLLIYAESSLEQMYTEYCSNKPKSDELVMKYKETYFEECKSRLKCRLRLNDYLIKPIQRITKYQLILDGIRKCSAKLGEDTTEYEKALDIITVVLKKANDLMSVAMLHGMDERLMEPDNIGSLVLQDSFTVAEGKGKSKGKERRVFLFEKALMFCEPVQQKGGLTVYSFLHSLKTRGLGQTETVENDPNKWAIWMRKIGGSEIYIFTADRPQTKNAWIQAIKQLNSSRKLNFFKGWHSERSHSRTSIRNPIPLRSSSAGDEPDAPSPKTARRSFYSKRISFKKATKEKDKSFSDRLRENIEKFKIEESSEIEEDFPDECTDSVPLDRRKDQSPENVIILRKEESHLNSLLCETKVMLAKQIYEDNPSEASRLFTEAVSCFFPFSDLERLQEIHKIREHLMFHCSTLYEEWKAKKINKEDSSVAFSTLHTSMVTTLLEAGRHSCDKVWSLVLFAMVATALQKEEKWQQAAGVFQKLADIYTSCNISWAAVDSLSDAYRMYHRAEDYKNAMSSLYEALQFTLLSQDFVKCLRLVHEVKKFSQEASIKLSGTPCGPTSDKQENEDCVYDILPVTSISTSLQHLTFLADMSEAMYKTDWSWFENNEKNLIKVNQKSDNDNSIIDPRLNALFKKLQDSLL